MFQTLFHGSKIPLPLVSLFLVPSLSGSLQPAVSEPLPTALRLVGPVPLTLRFRLQVARSTALEALGSRSACRAMFERFGTDGGRELSRTLYVGARSERDLEVCGERGAAAHTTVGGSRTVLCVAAFVRLPRHEAAVILLHEALHQAGQTEQPWDPEAPTSGELNRWVRKRCGL
jgi:hypothetical protein